MGAFGSINMNILVIEDNLDARANLRDILELDEHRVRVAGSAFEALRLGAPEWHSLDAIILDRKLPDSTAELLLPKLRALAPDAAILIVTGYADLQGAIAALRLGAADYILKPVDPALLRASLDRIAERRRLAADKERSEAAFRHLVEAADCMIVIVDPGGSILYFSPFAERLTGYTADEVLGRPFVALFIEDPDRTRVSRSFQKTDSQPTAPAFETRIRARDATRRWVAWNVRSLDDYAGTNAFLLVGQDITFVKQSQERALQAERLAAIGEVVTGLAHESRNALQRSQACLEMLALAVRDRPEALDLIARLQAAQDHLHHLYEDVRGYAAPIRVTSAWCDLKTIWREAWDHLETARAHAHAILKDCEGAFPCRADPVRMEQVFRNLLENALSTGPEVVVSISARQTTLEGNPAWHITIGDNGPGLRADQYDKIFEPFYTTKSKGTGLGLPIARRIVEAHGGRMGVDTKGPGATFWISLPQGNPS